MVLFRVLPVCLLMVLPVLAQQGPRGVTLTHIHVNSADPETAIKFWSGVLGTSTYSQGDQNGVSMLGAVILFSKGAVSGPSEGSSILHIGLHVPDVQKFAEKLATTSYKGKTQSSPTGDTLLIEGPDGVQIELAENSDMYTSLEFGHLHLQGPKPADMQAWYTKNLGARPGEELSSRLGGAAVVFSEAASVAPTKGRAVDHISVETRDIAALTKTLAVAGVALEPVAGAKVPTAFLADPWGTRIEVTEAQ